MQIELKDLQVGDEIIIPSNSNLKYLKILRPIQISPKRYEYRPDHILYRNVWCSLNREQIEHKEKRNGRDYTWKQYIYHCTPDNHNHELYINLNNRTLWLVKR